MCPYARCFNDHTKNFLYMPTYIRHNVCVSSKFFFCLQKYIMDIICEQLYVKLCTKNSINTYKTAELWKRFWLNWWFFGDGDHFIRFSWNFYGKKVFLEVGNLNFLPTIWKSSGSWCHIFANCSIWILNWKLIVVAGCIFFKFSHIIFLSSHTKQTLFSRLNMLYMHIWHMKQKQNVV